MRIIDHFKKVKDKEFQRTLLVNIVPDVALKDVDTLGDAIYNGISLTSLTGPWPGMGYWGYLRLHLTYDTPAYYWIEDIGRNLLSDDFSTLLNMVQDCPSMPYINYYHLIAALDGVGRLEKGKDHWINLYDKGPDPHYPCPVCLTHTVLTQSGTYTIIHGMTCPSCHFNLTANTGEQVIDLFNRMRV